MTLLAKRALLLLLCLCLAACSKNTESSTTGKSDAKKTAPEEEKPVEQLDATALFHDFVSPERQGAKLKGKLVEIHGKVINRVFERGHLCIQLAVADPTQRRHIRCFFEDQELPSIRRIRNNDEVAIKGICGDDIKFDQYIEFTDCKVTKGPPIR